MIEEAEQLQAVCSAIIAVTYTHINPTPHSLDAFSVITTLCLPVPACLPARRQPRRSSVHTYVKLSAEITNDRARAFALFQCTIELALGRFTSEARGVCDFVYSKPNFRGIVKADLFVSRAQKNVISLLK